MQRKLRHLLHLGVAAIEKEASKSPSITVSQLTHQQQIAINVEDSFYTVKKKKIKTVNLIATNNSALKKNNTL